MSNTHLMSAEVSTVARSRPAASPVVAAALRRGRVQLACEALSAGSLVMMTPSIELPGPADLVAAARTVSPGSVNLMLRYAGGLLRLAVTDDDARRLELRRQGGRATPPTTLREDYLVSIEARHGIATGISARDRARTIVTAATAVTSHEVVSPGHIVPTLARVGGSRARPGTPEAAIELCSAAHLEPPMAVLCHVMGSTGSPASPRQVRRVASALGAPVVSVDDVADSLGPRGAA
jgi:3,4-dihydroxy 2-butanone 4-phosphate synthase / GTP cyclohydrolase II